LGDNSTVFRLADPDALPVRYYKAWEYFVPGDEVEVKQSNADLQTGLVVDVMPDGAGLWVYVNGIGRRLFSADEDVDIIALKWAERADIAANPFNESRENQ